MFKNLFSTMILAAAAMVIFSANDAVAQPHHHHHHHHFNRQVVANYVHNLQFAIEGLETTLGACTLSFNEQHALEDTEELCSLTERFHQRVENFSVSKFMLQRDFRAMVDLAGHIDEVIDHSHDLHGNWRVMSYWRQIDWYMHRIGFQIGVPYHHH